MLHAKMTNTIVLPGGALIAENEADRPMVSSLKGVGLNIDALPWEKLYLLQDGVTTELRARVIQMALETHTGQRGLMNALKSKCSE